MAEKEANSVEVAKQVEEEKKAEESEIADGSYELIEPENIEGNGQDEVDASNGIPKRKKSGILGRLSTRKKKKKSPSKEESGDEGKNGSNVQLNEKTCHEEEEKTSETEEKTDTTVIDKQEDEIKDDAEKQEVCEPENTEIKKKKPGRLRRLSFSKMKKAKKQSKKDNKEEMDNEGNKDDSEKDEANFDSTKVQNVQEKCDVPETCDQSEDSMEINQPITEDITVKKENDVKGTDKLDDGTAEYKSYYSAVIQMPADIAQKALQTIKQVFKPVLVYIIRKNPHCFKEIIENNKKNGFGPTQL